MHQRTVVRSLTTSEGTLTAMDDGLVAWSPTKGRPRRHSMHAHPTVLLALRGPMGTVDTAVVGCADGSVTVLGLPRLETIARFDIGGGAVRSLCLLKTGTVAFLAGNQQGEVWALVNHTTQRATQLFTIDGPVSSLNITEEAIHVRSGWMHHVRTLEGAAVMDQNTSEGYAQHRYQRLGNVKPSEWLIT
ncbi:MAG: hypothetical protein DWC07_07890 [Candidatus Poseidoniales archaeon]|nr:MAG: hypothetical protein DWC07_07890 [Candidatus Poseidoniales archaeon]